MGRASGDLGEELAANAYEALRSGLQPRSRQLAQLFLMNAVSTIVAGTRRRPVGKLVQTALGSGGSGRFRLAGTTVSLDSYWAALAAGMAGHIDDFDDTHPVTYIHGGPTLAAVCLTLAQMERVSGARVLDAVALGYETQFRVAMAVSPEQYRAGWHSTGVFGVIGAAMASSVLMGLDAQTTRHALCLAAERIVGHQEGLGNFNKSFHAGKAAADGIDVALAAAAGVEASVEDSLTRLLEAISVSWPPRLVDASLGEQSHLPANRIKPFPCGIVAHPAVEAALELSERLPSVSSVRAIEVVCSPMAARMTGILSPTSSLDSRLSIPHAVAAALVTGRAGLEQFDDASVADPSIVAVRNVTRLNPSEEMPVEAVSIRVETDFGPLDAAVEEVVGGANRPMTENAVISKCRDLLATQLPDTEEVIGRMLTIEHAGSFGELIDLLMISGEQAQ